MRPVHALIVVILLVLVSALAWLAVRGGDPARSAAGPIAAAEPLAAPAAGEAVELARPGAEPLEAPGAERVAYGTAPSPEPVASSPSAAREGVLLRGRVVDPSGAGIEDARVLAASGRFPMPVPLDAEEPFGGLQRDSKEVRTGPDGRFELEGLRPGTLQLAVRAPGFAPLDRASIPLPSSAQHDLGELRLEPGVVLEGRVVDPRGAPVEGARILRLAAVESVFGMGGRPPGVPVATTAADGSFRADQIPSGAWTLAAVSEDYPDQVARGTAHAPGERQSGILIVLPEGERIQGRVVGAPPELAGELKVQAWPREGADGGPQAPADSQPEYAELREAPCEADGNFTLRGVRAGASYGLTAGRRGERPWMEVLSERATARAGERGVELRYRPEAALVLQVVDARTRQPLSELDVRAGVGWLAPHTDGSGRRVREYPEGRVRFGGLRSEEGARARLEIRAAGYRDHVQEDIALATRGETDLGVIALEPSPVLSVTVRGEDGRALAGARVTLAAAGSGGMRQVIALGDDEPEVLGRSSRTARTGEDGVARLSVIAGESCTLRVSHEDYAGWTSEPFNCPNAAAERDVQLTRGGSVRVRLVDAAGAPVPGGRVQHRDENETEGSHFPLGRDGRDVSDANGEVLFEHLAGGVHRFRALGAGSGSGAFAIPGGGLAFRSGGGSAREAGWTEVSVAEGEERELTLQAPASSRLHGRVREGGEPLAGATLRLEPRREPSERSHGFPFGGGASATSDGRGEYVFEAANEGEYTLVVTHPSRSMPAEVEVSLGGEEQRLDVDLAISVIEGRVRDTKGRPIEGAEVWAERASPASGSRTTIRATSAIRIGGGGGPQVTFSSGPDGPRARTDADGLYSLRGVTPGIELQVRAEGTGVQPGRSDPVQVAADQVRSGVDLKLEPAGWIEVTASKADGRPVASVFVSARFAGEADPKPEAKHAFIDEEGRTRLEGLAPGKWIVRGQRFDFGGGSSQATLPEQTIEVRAGEAAKAHFEVP